MYVMCQRLSVGSGRRRVLGEGFLYTLKWLQLHLMNI
jgi:hypothetical protein